MSIQVLAQKSPLLLIDDDRSLASLLAEYCSPGGFSITSASNGKEGLRLARQQRFVLIILDVMMPGMDGFEVLGCIRQTLQTPVLMLTTRGAAMDRVKGLENGADDYLAKPFQPEELLARIRSILRRIGHVRETRAKFILGDLAFDELGRTVLLKNERVDVTGSEFHLIKLLLTQPGIPFTREELIPSIFGRDPHVCDRSIDNLVNNLRRKLGPHLNGSDRIKSIRNVGYCYATQDDGADGQ